MQCDEVVVNRYMYFERSAELTGEEKESSLKNEDLRNHKTKNTQRAQNPAMPNLRSINNLGKAPKNGEKMLNGDVDSWLSQNVTNYSPVRSKLS